MKTIKQIVLRLFFVAEIGLFAWLFFVGKNGIAHINEVKKEMLKKQLKVTDILHEVVCLEKHIDNWKINSFYQEKLAREQLQMARAGEQVFYIE